MVRPFKIRDDIFISSGSSARRYGYEFDRVITLSRDDTPSDDVGPHEHTTDHIPLYDGPQTGYEDFERAVETTIEAIESDDERVLVHCQAGVSRSSTVLITALAVIDDVRFDETYNEVRDAKPTIAPHPALREFALDFLDEDGTPYKDPFAEN